MSRLIDDMRRKRQLDMPWFVAEDSHEAWVQHAKRVQTFLEDESMPVILCDNVAKYFYEASDQENWDLMEHFPNIAPPFEVAWYEHRFPRFINSAEKGVTHVANVSPNGRVGCLMMSIERASLPRAGSIHVDAKWVILAELFMDYGFRHGEVQGPSGTITISVGERGEHLGNPSMVLYAAPEREAMMRSFMAWVKPFLLTICFLHCKQVKLIDNTIPEPLVKKYQKHYGRTPTNYKTLVIEPLKAILSREGRSGEVGAAKSLHICRGHFKDYRQGAGLFGKHHILVWYEQALRGTKGEKAAPREIEVKV